MSNWEPIPTPNPAEFGIRVWASPQQVLGKMGALVVGVTTLKEFGLATVPASEGVGDYVYAGNGPIRQDGYMPFDFVKTRTPAERNTPFDEYEETEEIDWLPVLHWIEFYADYNSPLSQNTVDSSGRAGLVIVPSTRVLRSYVHGQNLKTIVKVREFLSEVPWEAALIASKQPMGTEMSWDKPGCHGSTGRCLHDEKTITGDAGPGSVVSNAGNPEAARGGGAPSQHFPRTNFLRWQNFVTNDVKRVAPRLFHRIERTYIAPRMPEPSITIS
jgi:hypothetical protein